MTKSTKSTQGTEGSFNTCAHLVQPEKDKVLQEQYDNLLKQGKDPLHVIFENQLSLQMSLHSKLPEFNPDPRDLTRNGTAGEVCDWVTRNRDCIADEMQELVVSLGQMSRGEKAASDIWKQWKSGHSKARDTKYSDFSNDDKLEVQMEFIDIFHFVINLGIGLGMSSSDIFKLYALKNEENMNRYEAGY